MCVVVNKFYVFIAVKYRLADDVDVAVIARSTPGFSGADLANIVNEAALFAARANKRAVDMEDFEKAKDKVIMGAERRSMVMTEEEKKLTLIMKQVMRLLAYWCQIMILCIK